MRHDNSSILELDGKEVSVFTPSKPREKWQRKRTHVKLRVRVLWCLVPRRVVLWNPHKETHLTDAMTESQEVCCLFYPQSVRPEPGPHLQTGKRRLPHFPMATWLRG